MAILPPLRSSDDDGVSFIAFPARDGEDSAIVETSMEMERINKSQEQQEYVFVHERCLQVLQCLTHLYHRFVLRFASFTSKLKREIDDCAQCSMTTLPSNKVGNMLNTSSYGNV